MNRKLSSTMKKKCSAFLFVCLLLPNQIVAFSPVARGVRYDPQLNVIPQVVASLLAGSVSGAIGIGVAYPLDTLKTKTQVMGEGGSRNMFDIMKYVYDKEGIQGFFGGVRTMMIGQAMVKAVAFCANDSALAFLENQSSGMDELTMFVIAACFSGFLASFITAPAERIKIIMQASGKELYENDWDCFTSILRTEGVGGLFSRGLGTTLLRDTPSYGIYFAVYHILMSSNLAHLLGNVVAPISFGAFSGSLSWLPVYPIDVVKVSEIVCGKASV